MEKYRSHFSDRYQVGIIVNRTYEEGLRDGAIQAFEKTQGKHEIRLNSHSTRLTRIERFMYIGIGALVFLQSFPLVRQFVEALG